MAVQFQKIPKASQPDGKKFCHNIYNFEIQHRVGIKHTNTDALSRKDIDSFPVHEDKTDYDWSEFHDAVDNIKDIERTNEIKKTANQLLKYTDSEMKELQKNDNEIGP